jgi:phospholipase C
VDETAILKLIETRFGLPSLTKRDADQLDMSQEFLDFTNAPFKTPPANVPPQNTSGPCYLDHLP